MSAALPPHLAQGVYSVYPVNLNTEYGFDGLLYLGSRGVVCNDEHIGLLFDLVIGLLGEHRLDDNVVVVHQSYTSSTILSESAVRISVLCFNIS